MPCLKSVEWVLLNFSKKEDKCTFSVRRQDRKVNVKEFLEKNTKGFENSFAGGHFASGGGYILAKDLEKFKENLRNSAKNS